MPKLNHPNFGDVQSYKFLSGSIVEVYSATDTADVSIPDAGTVHGVPIHYHCSGDVDSVQGGSAAFSVGDSVIVRVKIGSVDPEDMRILGFIDGPKECSRFIAIIGLYPVDIMENPDLNLCYLWDFGNNRLHRVYAGGVEVEQPNARNVLAIASGATAMASISSAYWYWPDAFDPGFYTWPTSGGAPFDDWYHDSGGPHDEFYLSWRQYRTETDFFGRYYEDLRGTPVNFDPLTEDYNDVNHSAIQMAYETKYNFTDDGSGNPVVTTSMERSVAITTLDVPAEWDFGSVDMEDDSPVPYVASDISPDERYPVNACIRIAVEPVSKKIMIGALSVYRKDTGESIAIKFWRKTYDDASGLWAGWEEISLPEVSGGVNVIYPLIFD